MIVKEKIMRNVCLTAFPEGCKKHTLNQIDYIKEHGKYVKKYKKVLIIGCSTGYGLASRIVTAFGQNAATLGVSYEREATEKKLGTPGFYNNKVVEHECSKDGIYCKTINGDAFKVEIKQEVIDEIKKSLGKVDLVVYSIAAPKRIDPVTKAEYASVLKPVLKDYSSLSCDIKKEIVTKVEIPIASDVEIEATKKVMGGEDWMLWIKALLENDCLSENVETVSYSYIGPKLTYPIYRTGTIGLAKEDLENTSKNLDKLLEPISGKAYVSVNKALVTRASSMIPVVPLYISLLYKVMKKYNFHEDCIHQIDRLFAAKLPNRITDDQGRLRLDELELMPKIQEEVEELWSKLKEGDEIDLSDFKNEYSHLHGFGYEDIDYERDIDPTIIY